MERVPMRASGMAVGAALPSRGARVAVRLPYEMLSGLGVVIADDGNIDREALRKRGALVIEDHLIPLVTPVARTQTVQLRARGAAAKKVDSWHLDAINVSGAWSKKLTGKGVLIGVLDTGIDASHRELKNALHGADAFAEFAKSGKLLSRTPRDAGTHGTSVCALLAGATVGVAPGAKLAVAAVLTEKLPDGTYAGQLTQISRGLNWLVTQPFRGPDDLPGVDVVNCSLGVTPYSDFLYRILMENGILISAAVGNNGTRGAGNHLSPANYDVSLGVGAIDRNDQVADFSDWGQVAEHDKMKKPDLCAPGVDVVSCEPGGGFGVANGTSLATPLVTAAAALVLEKRGLETAAVEVRRQVLRLVAPLPEKKRAGRGKLDLSRI